ncbi:MAG: hypothetical protein A3A98_02235 [Candidatus Staskawiczbacteria bacterium RIFCSPLOWO2_01_FULL_40_39]|uniref:Uncharacterized protein n=1 Tax=Candidatus Staskawiczbacteria bacterium RIFCSPHIGHO2_01_FULL_39_25 TaxID=1802202 RepID=A0A1G2HRF1_9BACT|nr:MAG: hypothetical protein A2730_03845 [Candidatus Staskawiczbacteria bacterium RIFCSPHIGHO2_01_FULL_39_25]OGZ74068.1 MAG: hypothetical protein A3A98_02235 [Candidatus Staskawiczbacteria bacterium RIFCSPLOWO2_01_FULL_40_39]OGZ74769.1 MAG: hypothetical protein A3I87_01335 [Candidatus Staskawiczbacteria bacterium RIFCSPLOWO2_02_FULL_39_8]
MINIIHLLKVTAAWTSIIYTVCYLGVAMYPPVRMMTMRYALHADINFVSGYFGLGYFISGLIIWNIIALLAVWFFAWLFNTIKQ